MIYTESEHIHMKGVKMNDLSSVLFDAYDVRNALSSQIKNRPKDNEGTDTTIGDCIDAIIEFLEGLELHQRGQA